MTIQKIDQRKYMHDEWSAFSVQNVGVGVKSDTLLSLYRESIIRYSER
jgi:hypothetical protein